MPTTAVYELYAKGSIKGTMKLYPMDMTRKK
jgi:hypothetical protein